MGGVCTMNEAEPIEPTRWTQACLLLVLLAIVIGGLLMWFGFVP